MDTIGVRELQQHAAAALRRIERGEVLGVTSRGRLVAVLAPPSSLGGIAALEDAGRVRRAASRRLPAPLVAATTVEEALIAVRAD